MKRFFKFLIPVLFLTLVLFAVTALAETTIEMPGDWITKYSEENPNSQTAILARFPDIPNDWSRAALIKAVQDGLLGGSDGKILPYDSLTRAQMAAILVRAFGASEQADVERFTDLSPDKWYYEDMAKAVQMGIFLGDESGTLRPEDSITRQEVFAVVSRAFDITGADIEALGKFTDSSDIEDWALEAAASLVAQGYINGSEGRIDPLSKITRAEFAQIMMNLVDAYITQPGTYTQLPNGNVVIRCADVVLEGVVPTGNLYIGEGVGKSVTLNDVKTDYRVVFRGGSGTVLTGEYAEVSVAANGITINASRAKIKSSYCVSGSVILVDNSGSDSSEDDQDEKDDGTDDNEEADSKEDKDDGTKNDNGKNDKKEDSGKIVVHGSSSDTTTPEQPTDPPTDPRDKDGDGWIDGWY